MKRTDAKKQLSRREAFHVLWADFRLCLREMPGLVLSRLAVRIFSAVSPYAGIWFSARLVDELAGDKDPQKLMLWAGLALICAALVSLASAFLERWQSTQGFTASRRLHRLYTDKFLRMDYVKCEDTAVQQHFATIEQNWSGPGRTVGDAMNILGGLVSAIVSILVGVGMTLSFFQSRVPPAGGALQVLDRPVMLILAAGLILLASMLPPLLLNRARQIETNLAGDHRLNNRLFGHFGYLGSTTKIAADIRLYGLVKFSDRYNNNKENTFHSAGLFAKLLRGKVGLLYASGVAASQLFGGMVYLYVCLKAWAGAFGIGAVTQYVASISRVASGVSELLSFAGKVRSEAPFIKLGLDFLNIPEEMYQGTLSVEKRRDREYEVEFRNVSFRYPGAEDFALQNVNLRFRVGSRLAVVGENGSGKTTFIKLLCRLYDPTEGEILLNGIDIRKYDPEQYYQVFAVVFQDWGLPAFRLRQIVAAGEGDPARVEECLRKVGFGEKLDSLPEGIETYITKDYDKHGVDLSGGEAQKVAIARALYKDAPFIILDEPTASLDPVAEAEIYEHFAEISGDRTAVYISHRLSSCKFCDEIAVFDRGRVVQQGSHEALLADTEGKYHALWNAQAQYYNQ
ncbi:MAG: ABC transporter ATP-binding protein [Clostridia bacterium]|nr:ABC transporter ATP-binding protein [Clostridia bacterium]